MELNSKTKISALLASYPFLKAFLINLNPNFKALDNPIMRNTIGRMATLTQVAMIGGFDFGELLAKIADEIKAKTGQEIAIRLDLSTPENRQEILKGIIKDLHKGVKLNILKKRFHNLIKEVSPSEIARMEQKLIEEGMPEQEVKLLCSVHVEVFKESLEKKTLPGLPAGHPVHTLMLENRFAESLFQEIEETKDPVKLTALFESLSEIDKHFLKKENQLFPILELKGITGPSKVMWAIHDDIRAALKEVRKRVTDGSVAENETKNLLVMMKDMIYKEEHIFYPMALETLTDEDWVRVKRGEEEIGYAWLKAVEKWQPSIGPGQAVLPDEQIGSLNLDTGRLTPEQVNLILTNLPVDISFVNENDEVVYYSQTRERVFPRSPGIIGRKVQNCHPPKSVDMVEKILNVFKKGERDTSEFWIQMNGKYLHIRYFAVRDHAGRYRGTLEVSQDITEMRNISGEKRLLDWE